MPTTTEEEIKRKERTRLAELETLFTGPKPGGGRPSWRRVRCVETGAVYNGASEAASRGVSQDGHAHKIHEACRNAPNGTAHGFHWEYVRASERP